MSEPSYAEQYEVDDLERRVAKLEELHESGLCLLTERDYLRSLLRDVLSRNSDGNKKLLLTKELIKKIEDAANGNLEYTP